MHAALAVHNQPESTRCLRAGPPCMQRDKLVCVRLSAGSPAQNQSQGMYAAQVEYATGSVGIQNTNFSGPMDRGESASHTFQLPENGYMAGWKFDMDEFQLNIVRILYSDDPQFDPKTDNKLQTWTFNSDAAPGSMNVDAILAQHNPFGWWTGVYGTSAVREDYILDIGVYVELLPVEFIFENFSYGKSSSTAPPEVVARHEIVMSRGGGNPKSTVTVRTRTAAAQRCC
jgi:hypothetical protein